MRTLYPLHLLTALFLMLTLPPVSVAQDVVEGREYKLIVPAQPPESSGKIEVIEFFSYACPHCAEFEPDLQVWIKRKPKDVEYRAMPMVFRQEWKAPAKLFFTLEAMGLLDKYHAKVYDAIHKERKELFTDPGVKEWAKSVGIDPAKFDEVYDSFGVDAKLQRAATIGKEYGVQFTPALAVNGKFLTGPSMVTSPPGGGPNSRLDYPRFFKVLDQLIDMARGKPAAKKKN
jgi:protein dithiol oxidoreductase (disulfide-forming)